MSRTPSDPPADLPRIPPRDPDTHKGTYGRALVIAGSPGMAGAAALTARAALRSGAGLVTAAIPESLSAVVTTIAPEATQLLLPGSTEDPSGDELVRRLEEARASGAFDALAAGPGLGTTARAARAVAVALAPGCPAVLDADALNAVADSPELADGPRDDRIWTPHPGEFRRLTGESPRGDAEREQAARRFVERFGGVLVLKGHHTVIADRDRVAVNETGNPGMATGGSGDVLTGAIVGLLAQGLPPFDAARLGAYVHGLAGDLARDDLGELALIAGDIIAYLPAAFRAVTGR